MVSRIRPRLQSILVRDPSLSSSKTTSALCEWRCTAQVVKAAGLKSDKASALAQRWISKVSPISPFLNPGLTGQFCAGKGPLYVKVCILRIPILVPTCPLSSCPIMRETRGFFVFFFITLKPRIE